ncbi:MAG: DUF1475 domain-containing protein [Candidatus Omnitrophica bacterium]|nr:DUF1475 domain-containing protein [Candidatus Omnitrophota bacterium]
MNGALKIFFAAVIAVMTWITVTASLDRNVLSAAADLGKDPWFLATLFDAYFAFLTFYLWVFYKESRLAVRILWFVLIMVLGNFAIASYMLIQLAGLKKGESPSAILMRRKAQG